MAKGAGPKQGEGRMCRPSDVSTQRRPLSAATPATPVVAVYFRRLLLSFVDVCLTNQRPCVSVVLVMAVYYYAQKLRTLPTLPTPPPTPPSAVASVASVAQLPVAPVVITKVQRCQIYHFLKIIVSIQIRKK